MVVRGVSQLEELGSAHWCMYGCWHVGMLGELDSGAGVSGPLDRLLGIEGLDAARSRGLVDNALIPGGG